MVIRDPRSVIRKSLILGLVLAFVPALAAAQPAGEVLTWEESLRQAAAVNPGDKFELVFKNLLDTLFLERMDQNEDIFVRFMNDVPFQKAVTAWMAAEAYRRLRERPE